MSDQGNKGKRQEVKEDTGEAKEVESTKISN